MPYVGCEQRIHLSSLMQSELECVQIFTESPDLVVMPCGTVATQIDLVSEQVGSIEAARSSWRIIYTRELGSK